MIWDKGLYFDGHERDDGNAVDDAITPETTTKVQADKLENSKTSYSTTAKFDIICLA